MGFIIEYTGATGIPYKLTADTRRGAEWIRDDIAFHTGKTVVIRRSDCSACVGRGELYGAGPCAAHTEDVWAGAR